MFPVTNLHDSHQLPHGARLILQDVDAVLKRTGDLPPRIEKMPHDFFQEQPPSCKGARAYYFHRIVRLAPPPGPTLQSLVTHFLKKLSVTI